jgi:hypothetical protein
MARKRLGEILMEDGLIDEDDLEEALKYKEQSGYRLGTSLVALRIIAEWQLTEALGKALQLPVVDLSSTQPSREALKRIPARLAERFDLIPLEMEGEGKDAQLLIAMSDPLNRTVLKRMQDVAGCPIRPALAGLSSIQRSIREHYHETAKSRIIKNAEKMSAARSGRMRVKSGAQLAPPSQVETMERLVSELKSMKEKGPMPVPLPTRENLGEYLLGLEVKLRALLHLALKKKLISEREYAQTIKHFLEVTGKE